VAKLPTFADGRGSEVFRGRVLHSMEYSAMAHADAAELVRGKRVAVVGAGKSAMDIVAQCAEANGEIDTIGRLMLLHCLPAASTSLQITKAHHLRLTGSRYPCTMVYRSAHWMLDPKLAITTSARWTELMVHKPGEGFALSLLATALTPLVTLAVAVYV